MQPPITPTRGTSDPDVVTRLIRDSPGVRIAGGCELLTGLDLMVAEDITADLVGGSVSRSAYATLHGRAQLQVSRELPWSSALVRPYMTMSDGVDLLQFRLGAYYTDTPARQLWETPISYDVQCTDILNVLDDFVGDAYAIPAGASYVDEIETILLSLGVVRYYIDPDRSDAVLPADRAWMFDAKTTWLSIVNDLAAAIGYGGAWSDWDGLIRVQRYISPRDRAAEWTYVTTLEDSTLAERASHRDFFASPNRWVFYRTNILGDSAPVEGAGKYTYTNDYIGETSTEARGRVITREPIGIDVADQAALEAAARRIIDADMQVPTKVTAAGFPNPLHWHFDVLNLDDVAIGPPVNALGSQWTLPLNGQNMNHEWTLL